jgi:hypothetical protein
MVAPSTTQVTLGPEPDYSMTSVEVSFDNKGGKRTFAALFIEVCCADKPAFQSVAWKVCFRAKTRHSSGRGQNGLN